MSYWHTVLVAWSLTQEGAGSSPFTVMIYIFSLNSVKTFMKNSNVLTEARGYPAPLPIDVAVHYSASQYNITVVTCVSSGVGTTGGPSG